MSIDSSPRGVALRVLFVCTGNICRSPTAERLAVMYGDQMQIPEFCPVSAGTNAVIANPIHPDAAEVLSKLGGDASDFSARQLNSAIAMGADLILTMTKSHREAVLERAPTQLRKTYTLHEAARLVTDFGARSVVDLSVLRPHLTSHDVPDVPDPLGRGPDFYAAVGSQIAALIPSVLRLCQRG